MLNITEIQKSLLLEYLPSAQEYIEKGDIDMILDLLDAKITEIGLDENQQWLNVVGLKLQRLYDQLLNL